ncbi:MAG: hypothetical protein ACOC1I_09155 [Spirochaetota bacterium]
MPEFGHDTLKRLASQTGYPRVTIHVPMVRAGAEVRKNRIELSNAANEAVKKLTDSGMKKNDAATFVQPVFDMAADDNRMEHQKDGLALFIDGSSYEEIQMPTTVDARVEVGSRYSLAPIMEPALENAEYALLALSLGGVGLYRASRFAAEYVELDGLPEDLCYVLRFDDFEKSAGHHHTTSARGDSVQHGHGMGKDEHDAFVKRFVEATEPLVTDWARKRAIPLVVIGSEDVVGHYLKDQHYDRVVDEHRFVDPHSLSIDDIIRIGIECMEPEFRARRDEAIGRFKAADHTAVDIYSVLPALVEGRVHTLFLDPAQEIRGAFEADTESVHVDPAPEHVTENLIDVALARALELGAEIVPVHGEIRTPAAILY